MPVLSYIPIRPAHVAQSDKRGRVLDRCFFASLTRAPRLGPWILSRLVGCHPMMRTLYVAPCSRNAETELSSVHPTSERLCVLYRMRLGPMMLSTLLPSALWT